MKLVTWDAYAPKGAVTPRTPPARSRVHVLSVSGDRTLCGHPIGANPEVRDVPRIVASVDGQCRMCLGYVIGSMSVNRKGTR